MLLALVGFLASALPAAGDPTPGADPTRIDPTATGTVTFHKFVNLKLDPAQHNGSEINVPNSATPLAGVVFTLTRINDIDLTTSAGWQRAYAYRTNLAAAAAAGGQTWTAPPTGTDGVSTLTGLPVGLYLLRQASAPIAGTTSVQTLLTVPMVSPTRDGEWMYGVHVYPKGDVPQISKTVTDGNAGVDGQDAPVAGRVLTYNFESGLPSDLRSLGGTCDRNGRIDAGPSLDGAGFAPHGMCADGAVWSGRAGDAAYRIVDDLTTMKVPGTSQHTSDFVEFMGDGWVGNLSASLPGGPLVACTTAATTACDYVVTRTAGRVQIDMTTRGMIALTAAKDESQTAKLSVSVQARVRAAVTTATTQTPAQLAGAVPAFVLDLPNKVLLFPSGPSVHAGRPTSSETVVTKYTSLKLHKINSSTGADLTGAAFTLYRTLDDARAGRNPLAQSAPTDQAGMTQLAGLHVTDFQNNAGDDDSYWVVETTTPKGFTGLSGPFEVKVLQSGATVGADETLGFPVVNTPTGGSQTTTQLPQTGVGPETYLAFGLGVLFIGAGALVLTHRRRGH